MTDRLVTDSTLPPAEQRLDPGERVGRYRVLRALGTGGMGMVYEARDDELDRTIALKLVFTGGESSSGSSARSRVVREAKAIAKLSHPNVIGVYDVGTFRDEVFLAMELAERGNLRVVLASREHTWREVRDYYVEAGRGLHAAHEVGLVHRDFKPDNVLVGGDGRAKVADFGIVRALEERQGGADDTIPADARVHDFATTLTQAGSIIGTPGYMPPEQMRGEPADARGDVFSFCVALYEGLYGARPFEGETLGELRANVEAGRIQAAPAHARVPEWLRAVVARGLAADAAARWPSMPPLLEALVRDPESVRRRRWLTVAAVAGAAALLASTALVARGALPAPCSGSQAQMAEVWSAARARAMQESFAATGAPFAATAYAASKRTVDAYANRWVQMHVDSCEATRVRKEQSEELLDLRGQCLRERREELRATVDAFARADVALVGRAQTVASALTPLEQCADAAALRGRRRAPADPRTRAKLDDQAARVAEGTALYRAGKLDEAEPIAAAALDVARAASDRALAASAEQLRGNVLLQRGQWGQAAHVLEQATIDAAASRADRVEAEAWTQLTRVRAELHELEAARTAAAYALAYADRIDDDALRARVLGNEATTDEYDGDFEASLRLRAQVLEIRRRLYGDRSPEVAVALGDMAHVLSQVDRSEEAAAVATEALSRFEAAYGPEHTQVADVLNTRANAYGGAGRLTEARADAERSLSILERIVGKDSERVSQPLLTLGELSCRQGDYEGSVERYRAAIRLKERVLPQDDAALTDPLSALSEPLVHLGRYDEALAAADRALRIATAHYAPDHEFMGWPLSASGAVRVAMGKYTEGIALLERALTLRRGHDDAEGTAATELALGRALYESGKDRKRGAELVRAARDAFVAVGPWRALDRAEAEGLLARWQ